MKTLVKSFGIPFLAGLAGAALWTGIFHKPEVNFLDQNQNLPPAFANQFIPESNQVTVAKDAPISFVEASQNSTESVVFIKNFSAEEKDTYFNYRTI